MASFDIDTFGGLIYGADYNPEQWPREVWREDARLMREAGVNLVSLGIFSWAWLEPREGEFTFDWLDEVLDVLHEHGVNVNLATATASPPPWLSLKYPDSRPVTVDGVRLEVGGRQLYCPSHQGFRNRMQVLVRAIAERYRTHPALKMWHINNEYGCHIDQCYCDHCAQKFRDWLREKYGTLDTLNFAWGTAFWSQRYFEWAEIQPPRRAPTYANPTQQLDWRRFSSDNLLELYRLEKSVLREVTPEIPVTTNFLGFLPGVDYFKWAQEEDVASLDAYPDPMNPLTHLEAGAVFDLTRSLRGGERWILMEEATSAVNWRLRNAPKPPGLMRLLNHQALALGASGIMFFQWRASKAGAEKFHSGLVQHPGPERSRTWREVKEFGAELKTLESLKDAGVESKVAILFDWNSWWALELDSKPANLKLLPLALRWYAALKGLGQNVDFVHPAGDLSNYRVLVMPNLYLLSEKDAGNVRQFVRGGGHLVGGYFSGIVDENEHIGLGGYPAFLRDVFGLWVEEWDVMPEGASRRVQFGESEIEITNWADLIHTEGAEVLAAFKDGWYAGNPAVTRHEFGQGRATYIGTELPDDTLKTVLKGVLDGANIPTLDLPPGLHVSTSRLRGDTLIHLLNASGQKAVTFQLPPGLLSFPAGEPVPDTLGLSPYGVQLLRFPGDFDLSALQISEA